MNAPANDPEPAREEGETFGGDLPLIDPRHWERQRFGWIESIYRDAGLSAQSQGIAYVLAFIFANRHSARCDPMIDEICDYTGRSKSTVKRALAELVERQWIVRNIRRGRGRSSGFGFVTRAQIVQLKGVRSGPSKQVRSEPFSGTQKGSDQTRKQVRSGPPYNIAEPCKNHGARATLDDLALKWAAKIDAGQSVPPSVLIPEIVNRILEHGLLTRAQLRAAGADC